MVWVPKESRDEAESKGYTVIESSAVIATHLTEVLRKQAHLLHTRQETQRLLDLAKQEDATCIEEAYQPWSASERSRRCSRTWSGKGFPSGI